MFSQLQCFVRAWRNYRTFVSLPEGRRKIVFYSEGAGYWGHFEPIIRHLRQDFNETVTYLSSDEADPVLKDRPHGVDGYYIGDGTARTLLFAGLQAQTMVMTMPDLQSFHIKRSPYPVNYVYVHHSIVSSHMIYRKEAFDHFDTIFCVGPHHVQETRARETQSGLPPKTLIEHGYGRLESLIKESEKKVWEKAKDSFRVLIAPSWGDSGLVERHGGTFIRPLLDAGYQVTLRPHPQTRRQHPKVLDDIFSEFGGRDGFVLEENIASKQSLLEADVMISDWSGAALEFAFALERPVLFVDVPRKINNPDYKTLGIEPLEASIRNQIGQVLPETQLQNIAVAIRDLMENQAYKIEEIAAERERYVFNPGDSGSIGAKALMNMLG